MNLVDIFKKDKKLFDSKIVSKDTINEDLGTLNAIDKKFQSIFSDRYYFTRKKQKIGHPTVGEHSPADYVETMKPSDATKLVFGEEAQKNKVQGMVLNIHGVQVLAISKIKEANYKGKAEFRVMLDVDSYVKIEKDDDRKKKVAKTLAGYDRPFKQGDTVETRELAEPAAKGILLAVYKAAKESGAEGISALVIGSDPERAKKQSQRKTARADMLPASGETIRGDKFRNDARSALRSRLEQFKANKAQEFKSPEEFLKSAIETGYMDKVNIDGFIYYLDRADLRISDIVKPGHWSNQNAIKYRLDTTHSKKLDDLKSQMWDLRDASKENPEMQAKLEELRTKFPPRELSIMMKMQGGSIVPANVEVSKEKEYY